MVLTERDLYVLSCLNEEMKPMYMILTRPFFEKLLKEYSGRQIYFIKRETYNKIDRDYRIYCEFRNGKSAKQLAGKHGISDSVVRKIVKKVRERLDELGC